MIIRAAFASAMLLLVSPASAQEAGKPTPAAPAEPAKTPSPGEDSKRIREEAHKRHDILVARQNERARQAIRSICSGC